MANLLQNPLYQAARAGKSVQPVSQPVTPPPQEPQAEPQSTAGYVGEQALNGLAAVGNVLDLPGSTARDVLTWLPGGTPAQNPFDQWLSPTSDKNRVAGRQYLRDYGLADKEDTWGNFLGGMAFEFLTDPLTPLEGFNALTRGGSALKAAGGSLKNVRNVTQKIVDAKAAAAGKVAPQVTKAGSAYRVTPRHYIESLPTKADLQKQFVDDLKKSAGEGFDPDNLSSTHKEMLKAHLEQTPNYDDALHDYQTAYRTKYGKMSPDIESEIEASLDKPLKAFLSFRVPFTPTAPTIVGPGKEVRTFGQVDQSLDDLVAKQADLPGNEAGLPRNPGGEGPSPSGGPEAGGGPSNSPAAPQSPSPSPAPATASPVTADAFRQMLTKTATSQDEADALYKIYEARAASAGESLDDYVGKRIGSVEKIDAEGPKVSGSNARGSFEVKDGKAIIKAFKGQNLSTLAHETGHLFRQDLTGDLLAETEKYVGVKSGKWETHHEERFARAWERYLRDGKAPTEGLKAVFENFKNWLTNIYVAIKGSPLATGVNKNIGKVFDQLLTPAKQGDEAMSAVAPAAKSVADEGASLADDAVDAGRAVEAVGDSIPTEPVSEASSSVARESDVAKVADPVDVATEVAQPDQPGDRVSPNAVSPNATVSSAVKQAETVKQEPPVPPRVDADRPVPADMGRNTPPVRTDFTNARTGQPAQAIAQALKSPESIMPEDLGMLLETVPESERSALSDALRQARPDLSGQVEDASAGLKSALNAMPEANPLMAAAKRGRGRPPRADVELPLPAEPTQHLPGTPERLEVMRQRVERGEAALHPDDAKATSQATNPLLARSAPIEDVPANPLDEMAGPSEETLKRMEGASTGVATGKDLSSQAKAYEILSQIPLNGMHGHTTVKQSQYLRRLLGIQGKATKHVFHPDDIPGLNVVGGQPKNASFSIKFLGDQPAFITRHDYAAEVEARAKAQSLVDEGESIRSRLADLRAAGEEGGDSWNQLANRLSEVRHELDAFKEIPAPSGIAVTGEADAPGWASQKIAEASRPIEGGVPAITDTRGKGVQYHGARGPIKGLNEGYYSSDNIYGGEGTLYTTDALDIAKGYGRKNKSATVYSVSEKAPVKMFDMESPLTPETVSKVPALGGDFMQAAYEAAKEEVGDRAPNLREVMDAARSISQDFMMSKDDVQDAFAGVTAGLEQLGYGGMRHVGGLKTGRAPHEVKIYFRPHEQIDLAEHVDAADQLRSPAKSLQEIAESSQRTADESSRLLDTLRKGAESIQPPVQKNDLLSIAQKALNAQINPAGPLSFAGKELAGFRQQALKEMGVEVPAGQATEARLLNEYARQFGITGGSKSEIKASLRNAFEQHLTAGTKETPLQQSTKLIAEAAKAFESGDMDAMAKAINEAESILKKGDSVSPDVGPLHQSDAALPGEQPAPSIRAVVGAFKDQAQNWLKSLPKDKALMLADVFDGGGSLLSKLPTFRLAQSLFEPEVMSQVPVAGQRLGRLAYEANEMATMEHRQILEPIVKSFHDSGQFNDMALALKLGNDKGSIKRARDIINRRNGRLLEFLEGVREDLVTQEELNNPVLMHGVDLYSGLKDLEPQLALMRGVMDMQLVLDAAAGLRASKYQDKAGVLYFARQAVGPGKRSSNNPNVGRLLNTTAAHQLHRELRDIPGGTAFLDELSLDPNISAQYHSQPLMKKDIDSERFAAMRDYLMSRDDYAQKMFLDYDAFKADPDAYFKANPEEWTKLNGIISKVARLPTWYLDNNIPLFGWNLVHAFGRRVENGIRVRGMAKSLTTVLANAAYKTEKPGGFAIGQLMRDVGLRGNRAPMNIIEQMGVKDEYTKWHESNVKGILDRLDNDEVVNLDKTRSIKKDGDNYVISEKAADDSGEELAKGKKSKQAAEPKGDKLDTNEIEQTVVSREGLAQHIDDAYEFLDQQGYKVPVEMREIATKAMRPFSAPDNIGMLRRIAEKFTTMFRSHVTGPFLPFHVRNALNSISNAVFYNAYDPTGNAATRYTKPWWQANELRSGKVIKNLGQEVPRFREAGVTDEQATQEMARLAFIHGVVGDKVGISSEFLSESVGKYASQYPGMNKEVQPLLGKFSPPPPGITKLDAINPFNLKGGARPEMSTEFPYFNLKEYDENGYLPARWGMDMASYVEDVNRLSKFIAFLKQGYSPKAAADEVRKIDVDYSHLTQWERKYARFLFPFYTYSSAVLPNTIEDLIQHPNGKQAWTIRVMNRARDKDNTTPDHIQGTAAIPLPSLADGTRQYITGLGLSLEDPMSFAGLLAGDFRDAGRELLSRMNPLVKAPVEVVTGQSLFQDGPFGGRALNDLDPPIGRTLANVKQLATGEKTEGQAEPFVSQGFEYAVSSSPFSRYATYARSITDPRKWENPLWQMANLTTGVRLAQVSPAQQDSTLAQRLAKQLQEMGARTATQTYIPEYRKERMSEEELKQAEAVQEFYREVQKRSRQRRKEEREAKELQLALEKQPQ